MYTLRRNVKMTQDELKKLKSLLAQAKKELPECQEFFVNEGADWVLSLMGYDKCIITRTTSLYKVDAGVSVCLGSQPYY
jgi:hypothetical protein